MKARWALLAAYGSSGVAGLIYQVAWTRLLTLQMGHTTAAASTVVSSFMGGLAIGAFAAGRVSNGMAPRRALTLYACVEVIVALLALAVPLELHAVRPLLAASYNTQSSWLFPLVRVLCSVVIVFVPALGLGATFPLAVRAAAGLSRDPVPSAPSMYAMNTGGGALGALLAGFVLLPAIGIRGTTLVGVAAAGLAVLFVVLAMRWSPDVLVSEATENPDRRASGRALPRSHDDGSPTMMMIVVACTGFAGVVCEIAWTRVVAMIAGPTTYALAGTLAAVIIGLAVGSTVGARLGAAARRPAVWLTLVLIASALGTSAASFLAGSYVPHRFAQSWAVTSASAGTVILWHVAILSALLAPQSVALGIAFTLALSRRARGADASGTPARLYTVNTLAAVVGGLSAGFAIIPTLGLQQTLTLVAVVLLAAALAVLVFDSLSVSARIGGLVVTAAAIALAAMAPDWDRALLSAGIYKYAARVPKTLDLDEALKAGRLVYYREGASATVSVRRLSGTLSLAIDGKVDASNRGDMLTQKALAHLPLLLHPQPHDVAIIGLGSGVTLGAALTHPIARADVIELSPEVVEASQLFASDNRQALADPRVQLIRGDGRTHLALSSHQYDVIISEPSNPWIAGVAALFTREFFLDARARLAPGGVMCQWAHTYDISDEDLRSIVATFTSVFPEATLWMIGRNDVLLVASTGPLDDRMAGLATAWRRPGVEADLRSISAVEPFAFWSLFAAGPEALARYAESAEIQHDDRLALEFSGPRALARDTATNVTHLRELAAGSRPPVIQRAYSTAGARQWRDRAAMLAQADGYATAFDDYQRALALDPLDAESLQGLVTAAVATRREQEALSVLTGLKTSHPSSTTVAVALSKLHAAMGAAEAAVADAEQAASMRPIDPDALDQLGSLFVDAGDAEQVELVAEVLAGVDPDRPSAAYYAAAARFLRGDVEAAAGLAGLAVQLNPAYAQAQNLLGASHARAGDAIKARAAFEAALRIDPHDPATYINLGLLDLSQFKPQAAAANFLEALALEPDSQAASRGLREANASLRRGTAGN